MKKLVILTVIFTGIILIGISKTFAQNKQTVIEVYQFHSEHRCVTCLEIEKLTKEVIKTHPGVSFRLINVDEKKNSKLAEKFEATSTALFLVNPKTGKFKDMTTFAFMNAMGEKEKFKAGISKEIKEFSK